MKISYYGHSCFAVEINGKHLLFDPFITQNPLAKEVDNSNNPMKYGIVETDGGSDGINGGVGPTNDGSNRVSIYAQVEDLQATLDRVEHLGGRTILPPTEVPGGPRLAMFADPAGNITGLLIKK